MTYSISRSALAISLTLTAAQLLPAQVGHALKQQTAADRIEPITSLPLPPDEADAASKASMAAASTNGLGTRALGGFSTAIDDGETVHMIVGHSMFLNTQARLRRIYITNPAVLDSYTANPNQVLCTAKQTGISSLVVWDEAGTVHKYTVQADMDVAPVRAALLQALPQERIAVHADYNQLMLSGTVSTAAVADTALKLAALYSKDVSNTMIVSSSGVKQVQLKVHIVEVDRSKLSQFGFNFFSAGGKNLASTTTTQFPSTLNVGSSSSGGVASTVGQTTVAVSNPLNFLFYSSKFNVGATLQDLATSQVLQILAEPTLTTESGQKANFLSGGEFPFPVVQGGNGGLTSVTIQFRAYGVKVEFTPVVNPDGTIDLKVAPEVSALDFTNAVTISGYTIPAISTRRAETEVVLKSGESFAISGLLDRNTTDAYSKTPGIANVPILGQLFKSKNVNHSTTELVVIVTPSVVDPLTEAQTPATPAVAVKPLDPETFDKSFPKSKADKP
jgi:pilus assembly protein CpaC